MTKPAVVPVRFSHLKAFAKSPAHGKQSLSDERSDPSYAMERGTAVHALVFGTRKVTYYPKARNEKHTEYQEFLAKNPDSEILTVTEYDKANRIADAVRDNEIAMRCLVGSGIVNEETMFWTMADRLCRGTPDAGGIDLADLKCTGDASPEEFYWHLKRMHYHVQLAWYDLGRTVLGSPFRHRKIVAVEDKPPYVVQTYRIGPRLNEAGDKLAKLWFETLVNCERSSEYPGYSQIELEMEEASDDLVFEEDAAA